MSKLHHLGEAVSLVKDGDLLAFSGNMRMSPMSLIREIVRQGKGSLRLLCSASCAINADLLIGSNRTVSIEFPHLSLDEFGLARNFRRAAEQGTIICRDHV